MNGDDRDVGAGGNAGDAGARPRSSGEAFEVLRLDGPERTALRRRDRRTWILVSRERLAPGRLPLGLFVQLSRTGVAGASTLETEKAVGPGRLPLPAGIVPAGAALVISGILFLFGLLGMLGGWGDPVPAFAGAMVSPGELGAALLGLAGGIAVFRWLDAALLRARISGNTPVAWIRHGIPRVERVCWRLGLPLRDALAALLLPLAVYVAVAGWQSVFPGAAAGIGAGALLHILAGAYPLRPGPGSRLLEVVGGADDLSARLRWALVERFVPLPTAVETTTTRTTAIAALALAVWAAAVGGLLGRLSAPPPGGSTLWGHLWQLATAVGVGGWVLWLAYRIGRLFVDAARLTREPAMEPVHPPDAIRRAWARENPVVTHVPELREADWRWGAVPAGRLVIRRGSDDASFYWLARGSAHVVGRTENGDPAPLAVLRGGAGVGEVALLESRPRTADVVAREECVFAVLDRPAYEAAATAETDDRFREVVLASQSLARAAPLAGLGPEDRARWLAHGAPRRYGEGEVIVRQGEDERWIGLVVRGRLRVEREGDDVAILEPDGVLGEMAYLGGGRRSATLRAMEPTVIWRWDPAWLDGEVRTTGVAGALRALAEERDRGQG